MLLHPMVKEKMHLQEKSLFDLDLGVQYPLHHVTYAPTEFEVTTSKGLGMGAQWLSGREVDLRARGRGFEPHRCHCIVVLEQDKFILA